MKNRAFRGKTKKQTYYKNTIHLPRQYVVAYFAVCGIVAHVEDILRQYVPIFRIRKTISTIIFKAALSGGLFYFDLLSSRF